MTTEIDEKTNEFIRRRKLRLQQVREQSKDIAKRIRQRAKVEKLKQVVKLDANKKKEYFQRQELLVKTLEEFYAKGIKNFGTSHRNATEVELQENPAQKAPFSDPSKQRGKEATVELRRKKQEKLDQQKKLLDRKLLAREAANEASREKSTTVLNKLLTKSNQDPDTENADCIPEGDSNNCEKGSVVKCIDMATQWDLEPSEWEPNIPKLSLPKDDKDRENTDSKSDKSRRLDLFALSEEMPSSLRGGLTAQQEPARPSLTLVSEYLQTRGLRLRETDSIDSKKKNADELQKLKQTIIRARAPRAGTGVCQVHDEEMVPVPSWRAENNCGFCMHSVTHHKQFKPTRSSVHVNNILSPVKPLHPDLLPSSVLRSTTPLRRNKVPLKSSKEKNIDKTSKPSASNSSAPKRSSVTMYNHSTRVERDVPYNEERLVVRDSHIDDDAYSQAIKETSVNNTEQDHQKKVQEARSKIAIMKQDVEKEYRDTISVLNSLPKDMGNKPIRRAYMDKGRQQSIIDNRQQKLQQEYKKIVKDCNKPNCRKAKSKSPFKCDDDFESQDFQYSWMPVPESDGNLAIHTIPTSLREERAGNTVKFSKVDSYHEYRSRHKHTPPTKDTTQHKRVDETIPSDSDSGSSEMSSIEDIHLIKKDRSLKKTERLSDAERIIIFKILDSKKEKAKNSKVMKDIAKSLTIIEKNSTDRNKICTKTKAKKVSSDFNNRISFEELNEGVYKAVHENGTGDNIASMYFDKDGDRVELGEDEIKHGRPCCCSKSGSKDQHEKGTTSLQWESGDNPPQTQRPEKTCTDCKCGCKNPQPKLNRATKENISHPSARQPSAATSTSSFKTATDKANNALPDGGFIKLIDEGGEEAGKIYIGASGFLKDDAYEVVIQLRKKGDEKDVKEITTDLPRINEEDLSSKVSVPTNANLVTTPQEMAEAALGSSSKIILNEAKEHNKSNTDMSNQEVIVNVAEVQSNKNTISSAELCGTTNVPTKIVKEVSEKGVSTSFQESFAIPSHVPKSESNPRPATSTYTQTSMSSPNQRPVLFHMSSTTSTAYMSPPEMILPKFLREDHRMFDDDLYDPKNFEMQDKIEVTDECEYSEEYECKCKKCRHARKITMCSNIYRCKKDNNRTRQVKTPPITVRNEEDKNVGVPGSTSREYCQCRKCQSRNLIVKPTSSHSLKNERIASKQSSKHLKPRATPNSIPTKDGQQKRNKQMLNPIIRDYVNKLLALNKEGLKAVQVVDQDCSSVATPGSSIINMPNNINNEKSAVDLKISLEQIKSMLKQQILDECEKKTSNDSNVCIKDQFIYKKPKQPRKKTVHKVKSLNISKNLLRCKKTTEQKPSKIKPKSSSSSGKEEHLKTIKIQPFPSKSKIRSKSSPTPRSAPTQPEVMRSKTSTNIAPAKKPGDYCTSKSKTYVNSKERRSEPFRNTASSGLSCHRATATSMSPNSETSVPRHKGVNQETPSNMSTQTSNIESEINFLRFDEDKIQNMEKIADLTDKCTKRLSNLAKVLEEVRRNKSLVYSQISTSDTASDSDQKSDKNANKISGNIYQSLHDTQTSLELKSPNTSAPLEEFNDNKKADYVPFLSDIPKPGSFKTPTLELNFTTSSSNISNASSPKNENYELTTKKAKPPPALSRIYLKHVHDYVIPHELSTVVEVDSPMSVKLKSQTSRNETKLDAPDHHNKVVNGTYTAHRTEESNANPDLLVSAVDIPDQAKVLPTESSDDSKIQMIDMNQFNEIMLKPFYSLQEYAKHYNVGDDGSNLDDFARGDILNDEMSSLHSDGSLPDVISELLKRNIISEPFKFDTQSNVNSTTISSESTLSILALSKVRKEKKKSSVMFKNKENIGETSDTLSMSSNPDLENAFKMLGMGWASSTLKKTKERLALSSSTNTSSSSLSQFKIKSYNHNQDIPVLVTDTVSSVLNQSNKKQQTRNAPDTSKNAEQQTSITNSMTVKEFLTNELAKKITFNNKSKNETEEEFVSLFETKMPDDMKNASRMIREDSMNNSTRSNNNRARTSTPVQLFKSMTYQSSSSSNVSNGLFSNADDLSSVKHTSNSMKHSTSDKDDLTIPNFSLRLTKGSSNCSKSD